VENSGSRISMKMLRRGSVLRHHWSREGEFAATFLNVVTARLKAGAARIDADSSAFLDSVVSRLVVRPADLLSLCAMLGEERLAREFMRFYARHELADYDVLFAIVESPALFRALPDDPQWMEVAILLYGSAKLDECGDRKLTIDELAPLGVDVERSTVRSLVGSAFDAGVLADEDCERLLTVFPDDPYFRARLTERNKTE
jgi:hypothetical protein